MPEPEVKLLELLQCTSEDLDLRATSEGPFCVHGNCRENQLTAQRSLGKPIDLKDTDPRIDVHIKRKAQDQVQTGKHSDLVPSQRFPPLTPPPPAPRPPSSAKLYTELEELISECDTIIADLHSGKDHQSQKAATDTP